MYKNKSIFIKYFYIKRNASCLNLQKMCLFVIVVFCSAMSVDVKGETKARTILWMTVLGSVVMVRIIL